MENQINNQVQPTPIWDGEISQYNQHFMSGMQFHAPFIVTKFQQRSDLGDCIISTRPPYIVCKFHGFKTAVAVNRTDNPKLVAMAEREEQARVEYLQQRQQAFRNRIEADRQGITIRQLIEQQGRVYDEELDEPRIVCKVPGLNVYLELVGCLAPVPADEDIEWVGEKGVLSTLDSMMEWSQNIFDRQDRRARATQSTDPQPLTSWCNPYDPELRPWMPRKRGLGHTYIDPSRRPDLLFSKAPQGSADLGMIRTIKQATADNAARGIAPEDYGK